MSEKLMTRCRYCAWLKGSVPEIPKLAKLVMELDKLWKTPSKIFLGVIVFVGSLGSGLGTWSAPAIAPVITVEARDPNKGLRFAF